MTEFQIKLYADLMHLIEDSEAFYFKDFKLDDTFYRIFNYRLASYTEMCRPSAEECRGHMFEVDSAGNPLRLAALPMEKFYNLNENPKTTDLDMSAIDEVMLKADGSLISTYMHKGELRLKSKGSISSDQAIAAMAWLDLPENAIFKSELTQHEREDITFNMEWCAPDNRIVIAYDHPQLVILNARSKINGQYVPQSHFRATGQNEIADRWIEFIDYANIVSKAHRAVDLLEELNHIRDDPDTKLLSAYYGPMSLHSPSVSQGANDNLHNYRPDNIPKIATLTSTGDQFCAIVQHMIGIEGFVVRLKSGQHLKIKTEWYLVQHRAKDSINHLRRLYEAVLEEATDDLRTLFHDQPDIIETIADMEDKVESVYNHVVDTVERFYERNKGLDRKEYAILGQRELDRKLFGLAMSKYTGRDIDYKAFMKHNWKHFGFDFTENEVDE